MVADKTEEKKGKPVREASKRAKVETKRKDRSNVKKHKYLGDTNFWLVLFTLCLAVFSGVLTFSTYNAYKYHPPDVSVVYGSVLKLYVLNNSKYETCLTIVGISQVYNSGIADDDAFVRQQYWGLGTNTTMERDLGFSLIFVQGGEVIQRIRATEKVDARLSLEGSPYPIPVRAGGPAVEIPILLTSSTKEKFELNSRLNLTIGKDIKIEIIDPINKNVTANESAFVGPATISYIMGETTAKMETSDGRLLTIDVRYTEDVDTYKSWKKTFLSDRGIVAPVLIDPKQIEE